MNSLTPNYGHDRLQLFNIEVPLTFILQEFEAKREGSRDRWVAVRRDEDAEGRLRMDETYDCSFRKRHLLETIREVTQFIEAEGSKVYRVPAIKEATADDSSWVPSFSSSRRFSTHSTKCLEDWMLRSLAPTILKTISMNPWNGLQSNNYRTEGFEKAEYGGLALAKGREPERSSHTTLSWIRPTRPTSTVGSSSQCLSAIPSATSSFSGEQGIVGRAAGHKVTQQADRNLSGF